MSKKRIYLSSPTMHQEEQRFIQEAFDSNWVAPLGKNVDEFERETAIYTGIKHVVALSSGTAALHLAVRLLGIKEGDVVLVQSLTFAASVNPVIYEKGIPVLVDSEPETWNISPEALRRAIKKYPKAKALVLVNLYGTPAKLQEIMDICSEHDIPIIEDAAESLGSKYMGKHTGSFGNFGIYSFNGNKIITTSGGGMLVSDNEIAINRARFLATQAKEAARYYQHKTIGYNYRMSNIVAGIGRGQLLHIEEHIALKKKIHDFYTEAFKNNPYIHMNSYEKDKSEPNFWMSCITIEESSGVRPIDIILALEKENIESRHIWKPMHLQPVFKDYDFISHYEDERKPVSEDIFDRGLCLPSDIKNTEEDMIRVTTIINKLFNINNQGDDLCIKSI